MRKFFTRRFSPACATRSGFCASLAGENAALAQTRRRTGATAFDSAARHLPCWNGRRTRRRRSSAALANGDEEREGWAQTLQRNCAEHLADLLFLAPWLALPDLASATAGRRNSRSSIDAAFRCEQICARWIKTPGLPLTGRQLAPRIWPARARSQRPRPPAPARAGNPGPAKRRTGRDGFHFLVRSGARSVLHRLQRHRTPARHRASTICWLGGAACAVTSPSPRARCRRTTGSRWAAARRFARASRSWFRGAARCSSI